ncbi:hypothetical protein Tco_1004473 [Tanacetum coccineum]|uniref:Uncharacterized protein n=1 Tax=Tanacetum coccineum TaxID=301880 RepID=A0ABQ5FC61_9ASTR
MGYRGESCNHPGTTFTWAQVSLLSKSVKRRSRSRLSLNRNIYSHEVSGRKAAKEENQSSMYNIHIGTCVPTKSVKRVSLVPAGSSSSIPADYVSAGHVLVSADRDRIC